MSRSIRDAVKEHQQGRQEAAAAKPTQTPLTPGEAPIEFANTVCPQCKGDKAVPSPSLTRYIPCPSCQGSRCKPSDGGRLPHGSVMHAEYDGEKQRWSGRLDIYADDSRIAGARMVVAMFHGSMSGLFPLYRNLDLQYRAWEARRKGGTDGND